MKFAHIADCHLGSWRQPQMAFLNLKAFESVIERCISEKVDFVIIVGDFFDTAIPSIEVMRVAASNLRRLKENGIACFIIPGSHDYSISGKSMISVFDEGGLCIDLTQKEIIYKKVFLYGIAGKKGGMEQRQLLENKEDFRRLTDRIASLKKENKIESSVLLLHTTVNELLPGTLSNHAPSLSIADLPEGFDYYALGHIHASKILNKGKAAVAYPGPVFPSNFSELEQQHEASFLIIETENGSITERDITKVSFSFGKVINFEINANGETPLSLKEKISEKISSKDLKDAIVTLRIYGILKEGKVSEIDFGKLDEEANSSGVKCLLRNTSQLSSKEFEINADDIEFKNIEEIEQTTLKKAVKEGIITEEDIKSFFILAKIFNVEKLEGETTSTFESRIVKEAIKELNLEEIWNR
ncbi:MAG: DNA repair exonuclease [Candidatus Pacearchaeota archaeon]|nr:DNA repair exonuclease [Candidatus Pacearchaeota archaeon]